MTITIEAKPKKSVNVVLVGVEMRAFPPKALVAVNWGRRLKNVGRDPDKMLVEIGNMIGAIFGRKEVEGVLKRLADPEDDLDLGDVMELVTKMTEAATGNPPTLPTDSSPQP